MGGWAGGARRGEVKRDDFFFLFFFSLFFLVCLLLRGCNVTTRSPLDYQHSSEVILISIFGLLSVLPVARSLGARSSAPLEPAMGVKLYPGPPRVLVCAADAAALSVLLEVCKKY